ncbi:MAG TPA: hypothetical protein DD670_01680 [Planctomycetaceae bacterium]|nr:hypothetical protein [Planctomycetaceae bacterium]
MPEPSPSETSPFRHQDYTDSRPRGPHYTLCPGAHPPIGSDAFAKRMDRVGACLDAAGVGAIYLVHGTFVGDDAAGVVGELARVFPKASRAARRAIRQIVDKLSGEVGNYSGPFAEIFEQSINSPDRPHIPVRRFHWSSENHHLGRADGAVRLIHELVRRKPPAGRRILLLGHSHAGNVFALMTNLLAGNRDAVEQFFKATEIYYSWPVVHCVDVPVWIRVRDMLRRWPTALAEVPLDMVTFGTPVRYGWSDNGYSRLLHFINHRPCEGLPEYRAAFPPRLDDVTKAAGGDYVQQFGIAGTNTMPSVFAWRTWLADHRLNSLLQKDLPPENRRSRFRAGTIVPDAGTTLLVDYGPVQGDVSQHLAGHAVYTSRQWLLFHAEEIARRFYALDAGDE